MPFIGNSPYQVAFLTDTFSGNGSTTAFTMSVAPANTASVLVTVSGVVQDPSTYGVAGTTLTFSGAPPTGTGNISARYLGIPASGVTTTAYRTITEFTATAGQTTFTPPSYTVGFISVYRNGVMLGSADYTATNGTTVVLVLGATAGDLVTVESFLVSSVLNAIPATAGAVNGTYLQTGITITSPNIVGTPIMGASVITSGTAQASTSGTSIDFTSIPSWVKRITVMFTAVSTNGSSIPQIQLGTSGGPTTSGYLGAVSGSTTGVSSANLTTGLGLIRSGVMGSSTVWNGTATFTSLTGNTWTGFAVTGTSDSAAVCYSATSIALSGTLDRVRITTVNGTDTFDAGSINILYE